MMKSKGILFGLNYNYIEDATLKGCINDAIYIGDFLKNILEIPVEIFTDDINTINTTYDGILYNISKLAIESYKDDLDFAWIHFSGHGTNVLYRTKEDGILPSDCLSKGLITADILNNLFSLFNPKTKIFFVCDACHSGTIAELNYSWGINRKYVTENMNSKILSKMICISGCLDNEVSEDVFNILGDNKQYGALSASIITVLKYNPKLIENIFDLVDEIRKQLYIYNIPQYPELTSTYDLNIDPVVLLYTKKISKYYESPNTTKNIKLCDYIPPDSRPPTPVKNIYTRCIQPITNLQSPRVILYNNPPRIQYNNPHYQQQFTQLLQQPLQQSLQQQQYYYQQPIMQPYYQQYSKL